MTGFVFFDGPSEIDGEPIVGIATLKSSNKKTGNMLQTWILRKDVDPWTAVNDGKDKSICGGCKLRGIIENGKNKGRSCYVQVPQAPANIYKTYTAGKYPNYNTSLHNNAIRGRVLRMGAYGDPVAIPFTNWTPLVRLCNGHTGYTHQWRAGKFWRWRRYLMASTHTVEENNLAHSKGWRTFRTSTDGKREINEIVCPASEEMNFRTTCEQCKICCGNTRNFKKRGVVINIHGSASRINNAKKLYQLVK